MVVRDERLLLILDLQRVVLPGGTWAIPGSEDLATRLAAIAGRHAGPVIATRHRLVPAVARRSAAPDAAQPADRWVAFAERWRTELEQDPRWWELAAVLGDLPAVDKTTYSAWCVPEVREAARRSGGLIVTGVETDCCVAATVFDAVDDGTPVTVATDLVIGPDATGHAGLLAGLARLPEQVTLADSSTLGLDPAGANAAERPRTTD
jgi:nicotinamidase-related amidase